MLNLKRWFFSWSLWLSPIRMNAGPRLTKTLAELAVSPNRFIPKWRGLAHMKQGPVLQSLGARGGVSYSLQPPGRSTDSMTARLRSRALVGVEGADAVLQPQGITPCAPGTPAGLALLALVGRPAFMGDIAPVAKQPAHISLQPGNLPARTVGRPAFGRYSPGRQTTGPIGSGSSGGPACGHQHYPG